MPKQDEIPQLIEVIQNYTDTRKPTQEESAEILKSLTKNSKDIFEEAIKELSPTGTALKFDDGKLPLHLLSTEAMNQTAAVLAFGAEKYAAHNWRKGFVWSRPLSATMRHITAFNAGEDKDPESGLSHLAHAACCIMFLLEFEKTHKELDDRYKP
jgi:hypothetical protein